MNFLIRRILLAVATLLVVSIVTFLLFFAAPSDPAEALCGVRGCGEEQLAQIRATYGLDLPLYVQYFTFLGGIFFGRQIGVGGAAIDCVAPCFGVSMRTGEAVTDIIARGIPVTLSIVIGGFVLYMIIGVGLGVLAATRHRTIIDRIAVGGSIAGASLPIFFVGLILTTVLVYGLEVLPRPGYVDPTKDLAGWAGGMLLPWITLAIVNSAIYARLSRSAMLDALSQDFIRTARAKGLSTGTVNLKHALRAAITPIVTIAGLDLGAQLGGIAILENVFGLNGVGQIAVTAVAAVNFPVVMGVVLLAAFFVVVMNLVTDSMQLVLDPRIERR
ncbi:ABC transporter permease [Microbacterium croceum]|uniref:ABC transporter permease n=1 Tax=Microbacterium croceum TaxID=2851645 RepID=UPI0027DF3985|nr:ABC transporter permease [Microbacterium croceum]